MNYKRNGYSKLAAIALAMVLAPSASGGAEVMPPTEVSESTMPPTFVEVVKPEVSTKYQFRADGDLTKASGLPTYEWMPSDGQPKAIVIAVHGLTLHGRRYRVLGRALAANGFGLVAMDMRGFGRCKFDPNKNFSSAEDDRQKVSHEKSYNEIVKLATALRSKFPTQRLIVMGESLGCTFAVRLAAEHKDLVHGIVLSAPAVKVNPKMYIGHGNLRQGAKALVKPSHSVNLNSFMRNLVSPRTDVVNEMLDDPHILKALPLGPLISTDDFVGKTIDWGKQVDPHLPILIFQGSIDNCVSAKHVTDLTNAMPSDDQTVAWRGSYGHLQLETVFVRASILNALVTWMYDHSVEVRPRLKKAQDSINDVGGRLIE